MTSEVIETAKATQEVAKVAVKGLETSEKVGRFLAKVLGEPIEIATGMLGDKLKFMRWERQIRLVDRVREINHARRIEGKEIPVLPKLVIPILENASLEENDLLQDLWAKLLSSAQGKDSSKVVRSAFIDIIKQLEVVDAQILELIFSSHSDAVDKWEINVRSSIDITFSASDIMKILNISEQACEDSIDNLMRVRCIRSEIKGIEEIRIGSECAMIDKGNSSICLTSFGLRFIAACIKD